MQSTVLLVAHPGAGHLNPLLSIASRLRAQGHRCVFAGFGPESTLSAIRCAGFDLERLPSPLSALGFHLLPHLRGMMESAFAIELFTAQPLAYAAALRPLLRRLGVCAVLADFIFPGAALAAECERIPWVSVYHAGLTYPGPGIPPVGSGLDVGAPQSLWVRLLGRIQHLLQKRVHGRMQRARKALGLQWNPPVTAAWTSPWLTLVLTAAEAEAPRDPLPACSYFIGPCLDGRPTAADFPFHLLDPDRPRVYVSMGTVFDRRPQVLRRIVEGLRATPCQLVLAAGACYEHLRDVHDGRRVLVFRRVPQIALLRHVDAVISHGGNNTVTETLVAGRPLLVLPQGGEQDANAGRVTFLGAGLRANGACVRPDEIAFKARRLVEDGRFRAAAERVSAVLRSTDGEKTAGCLIDRLLEVGRPIERPHGYPSTIMADTPMPWQWGASPQVKEGTTQ